MGNAVNRPPGRLPGRGKHDAYGSRSGSGGRRLHPLYLREAWGQSRVTACLSRFQTWKRRRVPFDCAYHPGTLPLLEGDWKLAGGLRASGEAELLDQQGSRTIRVRGRIEGKAQGRCARCLDPVSKKLDGELDLFYYPMSVIARSEEISIHREETEVGFYEGDGLELDAVVREQVFVVAADAGTV